MADYAVPARKEESVTATWLAMGGLLFAGSMMIMISVFQVFEGLAAIIGSAFYNVPSNYPYKLDISTYGWIHLALGVIIGAAGAYLFIGKLWARIVAIGLAVVGALTNFLSIPYYPIWSILLVALNILVIWSVAAYGKELSDD